MDITMPASFPMDDFRAFGIAASSIYGDLMADSNLFDTEEKKRHFDWAWQAVRYRYRTCSETADLFRKLVTAPENAHWRAGGGDEELVYYLERHVYEFFKNGLSVFESFGFALYFLGGALQPNTFTRISDPPKITLAATARAFTRAFPSDSITTALGELVQKPEFLRIERTRNLVAHRVSGRRSIRGGSDGTTFWHEETWHIPGSNYTLEFGDDMLHALLSEVTAMLSVLILPAREFAERLELA